jgi:hypothetical protein
VDAPAPAGKQLVIQVTRQEAVADDYQDAHRGSHVATGKDPAGAHRPAAPTAGHRPEGQDIGLNFPEQLPTFDQSERQRPADGLPVSAEALDPLPQPRIGAGSRTILGAEAPPCPAKKEKATVLTKLEEV